MLHTLVRQDARVQENKRRRAQRGTTLEGTRSDRESRQEDKNDLRSANEEFEVQIRDFEQWRSLLDRPAVGSQAPGFRNSRDNECEEIAQYWNDPPPAAAVMSFFDDDVHDSRAWFKTTGRQSNDVRSELEGWVGRADECL